MPVLEASSPAPARPLGGCCASIKRCMRAVIPTPPRSLAELEVSTKSIHRDVEFMRDRLGLPIEYDGSRFGYFYTEPVKAFPTLQITEGELFALVVAERALQQYRGTSFEQPLLSALKKMEQSLPDTISLSLGDVAQTISFRTRAEPILDLEIFDALAKATAARRQLELTYRKPGQLKPEQRLLIRITSPISTGSGSFLPSITSARTSARSSPRASRPSAIPARPSSAVNHFLWTSVCAAVSASSPVRVNSMWSSASTRRGRVHPRKEVARFAATA